jgi:hypothetical protein
MRTILVHGGSCDMQLGWYNLAAATDPPPAASEIHPILPAGIETAADSRICASVVAGAGDRLPNAVTATTMMHAVPYRHDTDWLVCLSAARDTCRIWKKSL